MNRFIVKASFNTPVKLEKAKRGLIDLGVSRDDIDYISSPKKNGEGLKFETVSKSSILAIRLMLPFAALGFISYYLSLAKTTSLDFLGTLFSTDLSSLLLTTLMFSFAGLSIGYIWGKRYQLHTVVFKKKEKGSPNIVMAVSTPYENLKPIKDKLKDLAIKTTVTDAHAEVEVGLRAQ